jgi:hypothetical protein
MGELLGGLLLGLGWVCYGTYLWGRLAGEC